MIKQKSIGWQLNEASTGNSIQPARSRSTASKYRWHILQSQLTHMIVCYHLLELRSERADAIEGESWQAISRMKSRRDPIPSPIRFIRLPWTLWNFSFFFSQSGPVFLLAGVSLISFHNFDDAQTLNSTYSPWFAVLIAPCTTTRIPSGAIL